LVTVRSGWVGVAVGVLVGVGVIVGVLVGVGVNVGVAVGVGVIVGVLVGVGVNVGVAVGVGVNVGVAVGVLVAVGVNVDVGVLVAVGVNVGVLVAVGVNVGVLVAVGVNVGVGVGVAVGARTLVFSLAELLVSFDSDSTSRGSTVAVFVTEVSTPVETEPVIVMVAVMAGANAPRLQSTSPPVGEPSWTHEPRSVVTPEKAKLAGSVSMRRTALALPEPALLTSTV